MPKITLKEETYWKLLELKAKLKAKTWEELIDKISKQIEKTPIRTNTQNHNR